MLGTTVLQKDQKWRAGENMNFNVTSKVTFILLLTFSSFISFLKWNNVHTPLRKSHVAQVHASLLILLIYIFFSGEYLSIVKLMIWLVKFLHTSLKREYICYLLKAFSHKVLYHSNFLMINWSFKTRNVWWIRKWRNCDRKMSYGLLQQN